MAMGWGAEWDRQSRVVLGGELHRTGEVGVEWDWAGWSLLCDMGI